MADDTEAGKLLADFLAFKRQQDAAAAEDNDPDNDREVTIQNGQTVITLPWRKAREYDIDGFLSGIGIKRKAAPAGKDGDGAGSGKDGAAGPGKTAAGDGSNVRQFFQGGSKKAAGGTGS